MKVKIDKDEWYPVFDQYANGVEIEIPVEVWLRCCAAQREFTACQDILQKAYDEAEQ